MWRLTALLAVAATAAAQGEGADAAPFPETTYPGYEDQSIVAGAQSFQSSPPRYPSPWMDGLGDWADAYKRAQEFVSQLTLAEKVNITTGTGWESDACVGQTGSVPRVGFRSICLQDSPLGIRFADFVSAFPAGVNVAATWDRKSFYDRGYAMGSEHRDKGIDVQLGPVVGPIGRAPEGGRAWEGFTPDPYLSGVAVSGTIKGMQDAGVIACTKHLIGNEQEHFRQVGEAQGYGYNITDGGELSSNIDDTTMHELYLWAFADAVRAGTGSVMCSYTKVNNSYGCQNSQMINYLLKNELNFQGFVVSDWQAHHSGVSAILAGLDMSMPGDTLFDTDRAYWGANLTVAVLNGTVPQWRLDDAATRIVAAWYKVGRDKYQTPINFNSWSTDTYGYNHAYAQEGYGLINQHVDVRRDHAKVIRDVAVKSTVLLKNTGVLPLGNEKFTAVFGSDAGHNGWGEDGCPNRGCNNGTLAMGWGSGTAEFPYLVEPYEAIKAQVLSTGYGIVQGVTDNWATSQIAALASQASVALVFVNADSGEGFINIDGNEGDRLNLTLWNNGDVLVKNVSAICNNTIVVVHSVGAVELGAIKNNTNVTAIIWAGLPGQESGNAIVDVLYGKANPGGKLPFTMGAKRQDYGADVLYKPNNGDQSPQSNFKEGVFVDYRAFDKHNTEPVYEFGYGLSYSTFEISNLRVTPRTFKAYTPASGQTSAAPTLGSMSTNASDYLFPDGFQKVHYYIYPYLNSTDLPTAADDKFYGANTSSYIPEGATDGSAQPILAAGGGPGGNPGLWDVLYTAYVTVTNTGSVTGDEVPQLYVNLGCADDPVKVLRGFERVRLAPGQSATVSFDLTRRDLSNWDVVSQNWAITGCPKTLLAGSSSRILPLSQKIDVVQAGYASPPTGVNGTGSGVGNSTMMLKRRWDLQ